MYANQAPAYTQNANLVQQYQPPPVASQTPAYPPSPYPAAAASAAPSPPTYASPAQHPQLPTQHLQPPAQHPQPPAPSSTYQPPHAGQMLPPAAYVSYAQAAPPAASAAPPMYAQAYASAPQVPTYGANPPMGYSGPAGMPNGMPMASMFEQERRYVDLLQDRNVLGHTLEDNPLSLPHSVSSPGAIMDTSVFRFTMSAIPETQDMLKKCRAPLGLTLHPFRDLKSLTVMQTNIVRCRYCRTYINPFVSLPDQRRWKCNLCFRANDLPEEFLYDPKTQAYGDPRNRAELQQCTIEYIAPAEYMLRPPQAPIYLFVFDITAAATESGYLYTFTEQLLMNFERMPGDDRTLIGFIAFDSSLHFFEFFDPRKPPRELIVSDVESSFLPVPSGLLVSKREYYESICAFIQRIPSIFERSMINDSCLGTALQAAHSLVSPYGGRVTLMACSRPTTGQGVLKPLDTTVKSTGCTSTSDFYKRFALECTSQQVSIDLFAMTDAYMDLGTIAEAAKFSSGSVYFFPGFHLTREQLEVERFKRMFARYLTRKIGFEAVLRIRCSKGLSLHTFLGNFFVRSTDLLAMANVNPDTAIAVQVQYEEDLTNQATVGFQAALLYTSSRGDRRIRVHTMCIPVCREPQTIFSSFDVKASVTLLAKMAADRALNGGEAQDCREALINGAIDTLAAYNRSIGMQSGSLRAPIHGHLKYYPLFMLGLLKHSAFTARQSANKDEHVGDLLRIRSGSAELVLNEVYPLLYAVHTLAQSPELPRLPLSYERISADGIYLMDAGRVVLLYVCAHARPEILQQLFAAPSFAALDEDAPFEQRASPLSERLHEILRRLSQERCYFAPVVVVREDGQRRNWFTRRLVDDRSESAHSYVEFVRHVSQEASR